MMFATTALGHHSLTPLPLPACWWAAEGRPWLEEGCCSADALEVVQLLQQAGWTPPRAQTRASLDW